jgi:hypothetical protein
MTKSEMKKIGKMTLKNVTLGSKQIAALEIGDTFITDAQRVFAIREVNVSLGSGPRPKAYAFTTESEEGLIEKWAPADVDVRVVTVKRL